jgi:serine/threonine-protein kinase RsbW
MAASEPAPAVQLVLRGEIAEIQRLADAIKAFGTLHGVPERIIGDFALASDELVTNTISYGGSGLQIEVELRIADGRLAMEIIDNGQPFDPFSAPPPDLAAPLGERPIGGLGVHIVRSLMDDVGYSCRQGLNHTTITKVISQQGSPQ